MSSINTNMSAMVALDTLKGINKNLGMVQSEISTGKSINNARDNAAIWSISTVMETDVAGFEQISDSLNLGSATVGVARVASEEVVSELKSIRDNIIAAQEGSVDRAKIQTDIDASVAQIEGYVSGAQFNGSNLLNESGSISVLASLDRSATGVAASKISVDKVNLDTKDNRVALVSGDDGFATVGSTLNNTTGTANTVEDAITLDTTDLADGDVVSYTFTIGEESVTATYTAATGNLTDDDIAGAINSAITAAGIEGVTATLDGPAIDFEVAAGTDASLAITAQTLNGVAISSGAGLLAVSADTDLDNPIPASNDQTAVTIGAAAAGEITNAVYEVTVGGETATYTAKATDTQDEVAAGLVTAINALGVEGVTAKTDGASVDFDISGGVDATATLTQQKVEEGKTVGELFGLADIDVTTDDGAAAALTDIEAFLTTAIDAAASFGSKQTRIDNQIDFVSSLSDSLKTGISTLVDANLEEASARLQALQVQQQLGVQALSIANQAPQALLSLFR